MEEFELNIIRQHWIKDDGQDDPEDLCSHGEVDLRIGSESLSHSNSGSWSLSTAGLFLMRTLYNDYHIGDFDNFLIPCCGHIIMPNDDSNTVTIYGCNQGVDWGVEHLTHTVKLSTENGTVIEISKSAYQRQILEFVKQVEAFYGPLEHKVLPKDEFDQQGFTQFWKEWHYLKAQLPQ